MKKIRLLLVDDHTVLRAGLRALLSTQLDIEVVGEAGGGYDAIQRACVLHPDVVILDITMQDMNGLEAATRIKRECPAARILILTMHEDERYLHSALKSGASGYLIKRAADSELVSAIRAVARGEMVIHSSMTKALIEDALGVRTPDPSPAEVHRLSDREKEVLRLIALGYTYEQIGEQLTVSAKTVATYKARLMEKLGIQGRNALVRYAMDQGWLDPIEPR